MKNLIINETRKWTIALITLFALGIFTFQNTSAQIETGFLIGGSINEMHGDNSAGFGKKGLRTGIQLNWNLSDRVALSSGLIYTQKGSVVPELFQRNSTFKSNLHLSYLEAPLLVKYKSDEGLFVAGGFTLGKLLNVYGENFDQSEIKFEYQDEFKKWELGVMAQIGFRFNDNWELNGTWSQSIGSIYTQEIPDKNALQNQQFSVGLTFYPQL